MTHGGTAEEEEEEEEEEECILVSPLALFLEGIELRHSEEFLPIPHNATEDIMRSLR